MSNNSSNTNETDQILIENNPPNNNENNNIENTENNDIQADIDIIKEKYDNNNNNKSNRSSIISSDSDLSDNESVISETIEEVGGKILNVESGIIGAFQNQHRLLESILSQIRKANLRLDNIECRVSGIEDGLAEYVTNIVFDIVNGKRDFKSAIQNAGNINSEYSNESNVTNPSLSTSNVNINENNIKNETNEKSEENVSDKQIDKNVNAVKIDTEDNIGLNETPVSTPTASEVGTPTSRKNKVKPHRAKKGNRPVSPNFDYTSWNHKSPTSKSKSDEISNFGKTLTDISQALYTLKDRVDEMEKGKKSMFSKSSNTSSNNKEGSVGGQIAEENKEPESDEDILAGLYARIESLERKINDGWLSINGKQVVISQNTNLNDYVTKVNNELKEIKENVYL